ncbi:MAG: hypothetical protein HZA16_12255 [Nitrospirae bacterium]|nr:hypothetical protein [Nitrospirota bacterium]
MSRFNAPSLFLSAVLSCILVAFIFSGCATLPVTKDHLKSVVLSGKVVQYAGNEEWGPGDIRDTFGPEDNIYVFATFAWPHAGRGRGVHEHTVRWYTGNDLVSETKTKTDFSKAPFEVLSWLPAAALGYGPHSIEILIDGESVARKSFTVEE